MKTTHKTLDPSPTNTVWTDFNSVDRELHVLGLVKNCDHTPHLGEHVLIRDYEGNSCEGNIVRIDGELLSMEMTDGTWRSANEMRVDDLTQEQVNELREPGPASLWRSRPGMSSYGGVGLVLAAGASTVWSCHGRGTSRQPCPGASSPVASSLGMARQLRLVEARRVA